MLDPQNRQLLRDVLRPPVGFELDRAIITTYSLDLMTLLTVPLAFTFFQLKDQDGPLAADPLALLEALRRHSRRLTIFCQAGQIQLPRKVQLLLGYVEGSVFEVTASKNRGVFHPKVTILRYITTQSAVDEGADRDVVLYRALCSSRNLTFDRSWDTMLVLDGQLSLGRKNAYARNRPLARFVQELPKLLLHDAALERLAHVSQIADELQRVEFETPEGFDELEFCPIGIEGGVSWPMLGYSRMLVMAPFVGDEFIRRLTIDGGQYHLISRHESLDELSERSLGTLTNSYYMNSAADPTDAAILDDQSEPKTEPTPPAAKDDDRVTVEPSIQLSGLHAKLFIADDGWNAHLWTGSANATPAAFENNVEFLVRLTGKKSRCGVSSFIESNGDKGEDGKARTDRAVRFSDFLLRYERTGPPVIDSEFKRLEDALDRARSAVVAARIAGSILQHDAQPDRYELRLALPAGSDLSWPDNVKVECSPITLRENFRALPPLRSAMVMFAPMSFEALTSFIGFRLTARAGDRELNCGFVLNVPTTGMPADREGRMLLSLLRNREQLLRYLLMLLADDEEAAARIAEILETDQGGDNANGDSNGGFGLPLLEPLLQTLDRQPARLEQIARLIDDLQSTPEGRLLVTEDFLQIWRPIWATVVALRGSARP